MKQTLGPLRRRKWMKAFAVGFGLLLAVSAALGTKSPKPERDKSIKQWAEGPARYLMTANEYEEIKKLKTVPDLAQFITHFWSRRDPTPGTFENEYRRMYWDRVIDANKRFQVSTTPGWKTDRGKIFILLGEPDDIETAESPMVVGSFERQKPGGDDKGHRGVIRWTYKRKFSKAAAPEFVVAFVADESMDWKLSSNADLIKPFMPGISTGGDDPGFKDIGTLPSAAQVAAGGAPSQLTVSTAPAYPPLPDASTGALLNYDLGLEVSVPSNTELVLATVTAQAFLSGFTAAPRFEFFRAKDGSTFINLGALVSTSELYGDRAEGVSHLVLYASVVAKDDPANVRYATNEKAPKVYDLKEGPPPGGLLDLWTGLALAPGRYVATVAVEDALTGRLGRVSAEVEAPDFTAPQLAFSSVVAASSISDSGGRLGVAARPSGMFRRSESFGIYYEVYGLKEKDGAVRFDTSYRIYREIEGTFTPLGKPIVFPDRTEAVQAWSFPLAKAPSGRYRVEVTATDPEGNSMMASVPFELID